MAQSPRIRDEGSLGEANSKGGQQPPPDRRTVNVGEPWPGDLEIVDVEKLKARTITRLGTLFGVMQVSFVAYAMLTGDQELLRETFKVVELGLMYVAVWAGGSAALRALARIRLKS